MFVPIGAQHFETTYLSGGADMFANAGTDIVVANANQTDGAGHIVRKTVERDFIGQLTELTELEGDEQASLAILNRILGKKNLSPKTAGHTQSYDFQAARINKCFKYLFGYSR